MRKFAALFIFSLALLGSCSNDDGVNLPAPNPEDFLGEIDFITKIVLMGPLKARIFEKNRQPYELETMSDLSSLN